MKYRGVKMDNTKTKKPIKKQKILLKWVVKVKKKTTDGHTICICGRGMNCGR